MKEIRAKRGETFTFSLSKTLGKTKEKQCWYAARQDACGPAAVEVGDRTLNSDRTLSRPDGKTISEYCRHLPLGLTASLQL